VGLGNILEDVDICVSWLFWGGEHLLTRETGHRFGRAWLMLSLSRRGYHESLGRVGKWRFEGLGGVLGKKLMYDTRHVLLS
jgi:hypothetical protein